MKLRKRRVNDDTFTVQQPGNAMLAAATTISRAQLRGTLNASGSSSWQDTGWQHYDICGELRFGCTWIGNALSRARLFAARLPENSEDEPVAEEDGPAAELVSSICNGAAGQSQMLQRVGVHLSVPGESFLVTFNRAQLKTTNPDPDEPPPAPGTGTQEWATLCSDEISEEAGRVYVQLNGEKVELPEEHLIIRMWRPHPRKHWEADSPVRGLLPVLHELERLTAHVIAQTESRLAGAGVLLLPDNISFPAQDEEGNVRQGASAQEFLTLLASAMVTPITNRDSASAVVPIIAQGSAEAIAAVKHLTFSTPLDAASLSLRQEAIRRLALGLDMPPEILLGLSDANHWSAWEISDGAVTQHIEPLLAVVAHALTDGYLRPALAQQGIPDAEQYVVWYDTSELVNRPNRGPDALELYDRGELTGSALRREHGFNDADAPLAVERRQRELRDLLKGAGIDSSTANRLLELLGYVEPGQVATAPTEGGPALVPSTRVDSGPPAPAPEPRAIPQRPTAPADSAPAAASAGAGALALQVVAQYAASAALDYAGKRLIASDRAFRSRFRDVPHHMLHTRIPVTVDGQYRCDTMLDGAFRTFDQMPDLHPIRTIVESHVRGLLLAGKPLDRKHLYAEVAKVVGP